jgi:hypothetical protein
MSLTYEKAKELKDAGFPQSFKECNNCCFDNVGAIWDEKKFYHVYSPTLEELIEACGEKFGGLQKRGDKYYAFHSRYLTNPDNNFLGQTKDVVEVFNTPEKALANLWLAIQK